MHAAATFHEHAVDAFLDGGEKNGASEIDGTGGGLVEHVADEVVVVGQRAEDVGTAGVDDEADAFRAEGVERIADTVLSRFQSIGGSVLGQHGA